jgi:hypothetical protein
MGPAWNMEALWRASHRGGHCYFALRFTQAVRLAPAISAACASHVTVKATHCGLRFRGLSLLTAYLFGGERLLRDLAAAAPWALQPARALTNFSSSFSAGFVM